VSITYEEIFDIYAKTSRVDRYKGRWSIGYRTARELVALGWPTSATEVLLLGHPVDLRLGEGIDFVAYDPPCWPPSPARTIR